MATATASSKVSDAVPARIQTVSRPTPPTPDTEMQEGPRGGLLATALDASLRRPPMHFYSGVDTHVLVSCKNAWNRAAGLVVESAAGKIENNGFVLGVSATWS